MEKKVYYHDTDAGGVVYYGRYLNWLEEARTELIDACGFTVPQLNQQGIVFAVQECHVYYKKPARYGDVLTCSARIEKITPARLFMKQDVVRKSDGAVVLEAQVTLCCLNREFRPRPIPAEMVPLLEKTIA